MTVRFAKRIRQKGFTLIELMLVLGLATLLSIAAIQASKKEGESQIAYAAATQMQELNSALTKQIAKDYASYIGSPRTTITIADLQASGLLPTFYANRTPFGGSFNMEVVSSGGATPNLTGLITTTPWLGAGGSPRYDLLGAAIRKIGAQGGVTYYSTNTIAGLNGGWSAVQGVNPNEFTFISAPGQLAVRSYTDLVGQDNLYLRRDGMLPMLGSLDMGFHDINNAVNISAQGWVYANHIASNDATIGSIFSNYIRNTGGIDTAQITGVGTSSVANFEYLTARTRIDTPDIVVANTTTTGKVRLVDTVTVGAACTPTGLVSRNTVGVVLSCQSGVWKTLGDKPSPTPLYAYTPSNQYLSGCYATPGYVTVTTPGYYAINIDANAYRYWGSYVTVYVWLANPGGGSVCSATDNLPAGGGTGYFTPGGFCVEYLTPGVHSINVGGSDASACGTSNLYMLFGGSAKLRLINPD